MAAPEFVPVRPTDRPRAYASPDHVPRDWHADRPGDLGAHQPSGPQFGSPGPDQGYALFLARRFEDRVHLAPGEHLADAVAGAVAVATKRSSLFGRAPVIHDLDVAFTVWGFLDPAPDPGLVEARRPLFEGVSLPVHYTEARRVADAVGEATLRLTPQQSRDAHARDWRSLLDLP